MANRQPRLVSRQGSLVHLAELQVHLGSARQQKNLGFWLVRGGLGLRLSTAERFHGASFEFIDHVPDSSARRLRWRDLHCGG